MTDKYLLEKFNDDLLQHIKKIEDLTITRKGKQQLKDPIIFGEMENEFEHDYDISFLNVLSTFDKSQHFSNCLNTLRSYKKFLNTLDEYENVDFRILSQQSERTATFINGFKNNLNTSKLTEKQQEKFKIMNDILDTLIVSFFLIENYTNENIIMSEENMAQIRNIFLFSKNKMDIS